SELRRDEGGLIVQQWPVGVFAELLHFFQVRSTAQDHAALYPKVRSLCDGTPCAVSRLLALHPNAQRLGKRITQQGREIRRSHGSAQHDLRRLAVNMPSTSIHASARHFQDAHPTE